MRLSYILVLIYIKYQGPSTEYSINVSYYFDYVSS